MASFKPAPPDLPPRKTLYESSPHVPPPPPPPLPPLEESTDALSLWAYTTSATLAALAAPLLLFPRLLLFLAGGFDDGRPGGGSPHDDWSGRNAELSGLERFLAGQLGLLLLGFAIIVLVLASPAPAHVDATIAADAAYDRFKTVAVTTPLLFLSSFLAYTSTLGSLATVMSVATGGLGIFGAWVLMFNDEPASLSKSTHADKHTSSFPFQNKASASSIKKRFKWKPSRPDPAVAPVRQRATAGDPLAAAEEIELKTR